MSNPPEARATLPAMPNPWDPTRFRRIALQVVMWLILCAAVGLAAAVSHHRREMLKVPLSPPVRAGELTFRLPEGWQMRQRAARDASLQAVEPGGTQRTLTVTSEPLRRMVSPQEYLARNHEPLAGGGGPVEIAGQPGVLLGRSHFYRLQTGELAASKQVVVCAVLPSRRAVVLELEGPGAVEPGDLELVRQIAATVEPSNRLQLLRPGRVELNGGISAALPHGLELIEEPDVRRLSRTLVRRVAGDAWLCLKLVPCLFDPGDGEATLQTMLSLHEPDWRFGTAKRQPGGDWRIDSPPPAEGKPSFPRRAYLHASQDGQALLAIFRGAGPEAEQEFERLWGDLSGPIVFHEKIDLPSLRQQGVSDARRLREFGLAHLLANQDPEQWWMWYAEPHVGWTHLAYAEGEEWEMRRETRWRFGGGQAGRVTQWATAGDDLEAYQAWTSAALAGVPSHAFDNAWVQHATALEEKVVIDTSAETAVRPVPAGPIPPGFVPGAWLRLVMDNLSSKPMILRTDLFFVGHDRPCPAEPMTVLVRPGRPASDEADPAPGRPVRTLHVQVNGSGESSEWGFDDQGDLVRIDLPGGAHVERVQRDTIRYTFADDPRMVP